MLKRSVALLGAAIVTVSLAAGCGCCKSKYRPDCAYGGCGDGTVIAPPPGAIYEGPPVGTPAPVPTPPPPQQ